MNSMDKIIISEFAMLNTSTPPEYYGNAGKEGKNIVANFKKRVRVQNIHKPDPMTMEFDLIGVDAAFANSLIISWRFKSLAMSNGVRP